MPRTYKPKKLAREPIPEAIISDDLIIGIVDQSLDGSDLSAPSISDTIALASLIRTIHAHYIYDEDEASAAAFRIDELISLSAKLGEPIPRDAFTSRWRTLAPIIGGAFSRIMVRAGNAEPRNGQKGAKVRFLVSLIPHLTKDRPDANSLHQCLQTAVNVSPPDGWPRSEAAGPSTTG